MDLLLYLLNTFFLCPLIIIIMLIKVIIIIIGVTISTLEECVPQMTV